MSELTKIKFENKDDLLKKLVLKKSDANKEGILDNLKKYLKRVKRGDKEAMRKVIKLREKILQANAEVYVEIEDDNLFQLCVAELEILETIDVE